MFWSHVCEQAWAKAPKAKAAALADMPEEKATALKKVTGRNGPQATCKHWTASGISARLLCGAYASETGSPFYTKGKSDADHLALHNLLSRLNPSTSEACNRMGVALSEAGGTLEMMARFVDKYLVADPKVTLQKVGLQALAEHMNKDSAKQLRERSMRPEQAQCRRREAEDEFARGRGCLGAILW